MTSSSSVLNGFGFLNHRRPSWQEDRNWVIFGCLFVYLVTLVLRLSLWTRWNHPVLMVNGEFILSTHDSYFWLAKAKGVGSMEGAPLAQLTWFVHEYLGIDYGAIGFWGPAFLASLVSVVAFLWGWLLGGRTAGLAAGLLGGMNPGFFYRSRLGYYDTDLFTLAMPLLVGWLLAYMLKGYLRNGWLPRSSGEDAEDAPSPTLWLALCFGLVAKGAIWWHFDITNVATIMFFAAVALVALVGAPAQKGRGFLALAIFALAAFPGMGLGNYRILLVRDLLSLFVEPSLADVFSNPLSGFVGVGLAAGIVLADRKGGADRFKGVWIPLGVLLLVVLAMGLVNGPIDALFGKILKYLKPVADIASEAGTAQGKVIYPAITQSIIEAGNVDLGEILRRMAFWPWLGWVSLICFGVVTVFRPSAVLLLPLVILSLASLKLGVRFTMFGGTCLAVGLSVVVDGMGTWIGERMFSADRAREFLRTGIQATVGLLILLLAFLQYRELLPTPVVAKSHAEALMALGRNVPKDSMIWTWWDWGYASQYYAGLETVVDGGQHAGRDIYPVALALATDSLQQAQQMIRFSAQFSPRSLLLRGYDPATQWDSMPAEDVVKLIEDMKTEEVAPPACRAQYLVVTWNDLSLGSWLSFYGNWNLLTGSSQKGKSALFHPGQIGVNLQLGAVRTPAGKGGLVDTMDELTESGNTHTSYLMNSFKQGYLRTSPHAIINRTLQQTVLYDDNLYHSVMCQLLLAKSDDPEVQKYFTLVVDAMPFARVYRVK